jgi:hypothetical protein
LGRVGNSRLGCCRAVMPLLSSLLASAVDLRNRHTLFYHPILSSVQVAFEPGIFHSISKVVTTEWKLRHQPQPTLDPRAEFAEMLRSIGGIVDGDYPIMNGEAQRIPAHDDRGVTGRSSTWRTWTVCRTATRKTIGTKRPCVGRRPADAMNAPSAYLEAENFWSDFGEDPGSDPGRGYSDRSGIVLLARDISTENR